MTDLQKCYENGLITASELQRLIDKDEETIEEELEGIQEAEACLRSYNNWFEGSRGCEG